MGANRAAVYFILAIFLAIMAACVAAPAASPASPVLTGAGTVTIQAGQVASPTPAASATLTPFFTSSPQGTCNNCTKSPTPVLATATASVPPEMVVKGEKLDVWDDPANENSYWHRQTQLITGERVLALATTPDGAWTQIIAADQPTKKDERGYPGWVRMSGLAQVPVTGEQSAVVIVRSAFIYAGQRQDSTRLLRLYLDARLPVVSSNGSWFESILPDGRTGWLKRGEVRLLPAGDQPVQAAQIIETARALAGAPYLWGGTTSDSPDCSGFTYRLFHAYGITLARDADDQAQMGIEVTFDQKKPGDLIFYADFSGGPVTHVGIYMGDNLLMDANPWLGLSLHPLADMQKWYVFHSVRRILP